MVSIITPVHNAAPTIGRCIESIIAQSHHDFELIIVDDGSEDDSLSICREYASKDHRITVIHLAHNQGVSNARNQGLDRASAPYITFIDADDWVSPDHLSKMLSSLNDSQLCITDMQMHHADRITTLGISDKQVTEKTEIVKLSRLFGSTCNALFCSSVINGNNLRFDTRIAQGEDTDFLMRYVYYINKVSLSSAATYHYLMPEASKQYNTSALLYSTIRIYENMLRLTSGFADDVRRSILHEELLEDIDWAIEGLFFCTSDDKPLLIEKFARYFYPHLHLSRRKSVRHRLFRLICRCSNHRFILASAKAALFINRLNGQMLKRPNA